ncbi:TylF/MycF/NovP-related O-methyltransferase [Terasakiella sp.]|uniref:TylF/MycF/NovP-related O-methyltransferase n=1 Tax=Terasakiella sp. TaxID=2034861 RepID=UPI003AA881EC
MKKHESAVVSYSSEDSLDARMALFHKMNEYQATDDEKERSLGLFLRGSLLARILATAEIYQMIIDKPGAILDIGTWRGQTAVLCENFRAIYEPLHFNRRIVCFDTFEGYKGFSEKDKATDLHKDGTYGVGGDDYVTFLEDLLCLHEQNNAMGHNNGKHKVIKGDCCETIPQFFAENAHEFVALAFFDVNSFVPTLDAFEKVWARLIPGGVVAFWQLTRNTIPAEGKVYAEEIIGKYGHSVRRTQNYPGLCYLVKE